ncbi:MAG: mandelate racemase/muconate lactonizing enzyme family protein, partial [Microbacterium sp.]|nr:mandelate racemase/muconate lactonizing enzyme family protein [Microbacterium sp.]
GMAMLRGKVRAAIASGENLTGLEQYGPLLDANALDIVQVGTVWGITHFLRVATLAHSHDLPVSTVAYNGNPIAHAASAVPNFLTHEVQDLAFPVGLDVDQEFDDGGIVLGDRPGIGIVVDEERLASAAAVPAAAASGPHVRPERAGLRMVAEPDVIEEPATAGGRRTP